MTFLPSLQVLFFRQNHSVSMSPPYDLDKIALVLIIIGAINWGLIGFFQFDLVATLFGNMSALSRIVYALVGISGLWGIKLLFDD